MRKEYDFSESKQNPYSEHLKQEIQEITIQVERSTVEYFKGLSKETGIPFQNLMNLFLLDCAKQHKKPLVNWTDSH